MSRFVPETMLEATDSDSRLQVSFAQALAHDHPKRKALAFHRSGGRKPTLAFRVHTVSTLSNLNSHANLGTTSRTGSGEKLSPHIRRNQNPQACLSRLSPDKP